MGYIGQAPANKAVTSADIEDNAITNAKIADDAVNTAELGAGAVDNAAMADNSVNSAEYVDGSIDTSHLGDNQVTLAKMAGLARGKLIYGDASGDPAALAVGGANEVLTHDGTDFDWAAASGGTYSVHAFSSFFYATAVTVSSGSASANISGSNYLTFTPTSQNDIFVISAMTIAHPTDYTVAGFGLGIQGSTATGFDGTETNFYHQGVYAEYANTSVDKYWVGNINGYHLLASDHAALVNDTAYYFRVMGQAHSARDIQFQPIISSEVNDGLYAYGIHLKKT